MVTFILLRWYSLKCDRRKVNFKFRKTYIIFRHCHRSYQ
ncbi:unnamed protein product [Musa acuminata var. zebrina]